MLQRKFIEKNISIARTVSIEAVLQPRFHCAVNYFSFDAGVLFLIFFFFSRHNGPASAAPVQEGQFWKRSES